MANYCCSKYGFRTACLELNSSTAFSQLKEQAILPFSIPSKHDCSHFSIYDVDYYPMLQSRDIPGLMNKGYHYLILDFGVMTADSFDEFLRCGHKIVIGSLAPWRGQSYYDFFRKYSLDKLRESFQFLILFGEKTDIAELSKKTATPLHHIFCFSFLKNPFHIAKEQFPFLEELL